MTESVAQRIKVGRVERSNLFNNERLVDCGEDWFDHRRAEQARVFPLRNDGLERRVDPRLGGNRHDNQVDALAMKGFGTHHDRGPFLVS